MENIEINDSFFSVSGTLVEDENVTHILKMKKVFNQVFFKQVSNLVIGFIPDQRNGSEGRLRYLGDQLA